MSGEDSTHGRDDDGELIPIYGLQPSFVEKHAVKPGDVLTRAVADLRTHFIAELEKSFKAKVVQSGFENADVPASFKPKCEDVVVFPVAFSTNATNQLSNNLFGSIGAVVGFVQTAQMYNEAQRAGLAKHCKQELAKALRAYFFQDQSEIAGVIISAVPTKNDAAWSLMQTVANDWVDAYLQRKQEAIPPRS
jgi:hypothetical protein